MDSNTVKKVTITGTDFYKGKNYTVQYSTVQYTVYCSTVLFCSVNRIGCRTDLHSESVL